MIIKNVSPNLLRCGHGNKVVGNIKGCDNGACVVLSDFAKTFSLPLCQLHYEMILKDIKVYNKSIKRGVNGNTKLISKPN